MPEKNKYKPFAKKSFGQNFLVDQNYIEKIISALNPNKDETVVEIGAGRGALTTKLLQSGADVIAVELDNDLIPLLKKEFGNFENFHLLENDALKVDYSKLNIQNSKLKTKLVANLPYYISTAILQHLIEHRANFERLVLMLQREVVERITAEAGNRERGFLTVLIEAYFETEKLFDVPPNAFRPAPKVWSAVIKLTPREIDFADNEILFRRLVSTGFRQKRKTIFNNLKNEGEILYNKDLAGILNKAEIELNRRAETLTLEEWIKLTEKISDAD